MPEGTIPRLQSPPFYDCDVRVWIRGVWIRGVWGGGAVLGTIIGPSCRACAPRAAS